MIILRIHCPSESVARERRDEMYRALAGSPASISADIAVYDDETYTFCLLVGKANDEDICYDVNESDLVTL